MPKMNQILAIEKGTKKKVYAELTKEHQKLQKPDLMAGISRTYRPLDEEGEKYPDEENLVQVRVDEVIQTTATKLAEFFDIVAAKDFTNCEAKADIIVDEGLDTQQVIAEGVPATHLLWLAKELDDLYTFVSKLQTLPAAHHWERDDQQNCWRSKPVETAKKKKFARAFVKYEATKEHPAQVETIHEDKIEGYWTTTAFSGALQGSRVAQMKERVQKLQKAVGFAREKANSREAEMPKIGDKILRFAFALD